jgi:hypothetical protein
MERIHHGYEPEEPGQFCYALAIGDSWFWYPNQNTMETLVRHPATYDDHANVRLIGDNGAMLRRNTPVSANMPRKLNTGSRPTSTTVFPSSASAALAMARSITRWPCAKIARPSALHGNTSTLMA